MNAAARALTSILTLTAASLLVAGGGDEGEDRGRRGPHARGLAELAAGSYAAAAASFRAAIAERGDATGRAAAELHYNLALALWRAGELDEAETAAEKAATLADGRFDALRDGLLGNLRYDAAVRVEAEDLQQALDLAVQAEQHYLRGALLPGAPAALARNLERAQKKIEELKKKIEEQEKQEQEDPDKQDQEPGDDEKKDDGQDENQKQDDEKKDDQQPGDQKQDPESQQDEQSQEQEPQQEPQPDEGDDPPQPDEQQGEQPKEEKAPAPGEQAEGRELTPEEKKRLLDKLEQFEAELRALRERQKAGRPKVEKDW